MGRLCGLSWSEWWYGCIAKLAGQTSDYISDRLYAYKNREQIGAMSSTMWAVQYVI